MGRRFHRRRACLCCCHRWGSLAELIIAGSHLRRSSSIDCGVASVALQKLRGRLEMWCSMADDPRQHAREAKARRGCLSKLQWPAQHVGAFQQDVLVMATSTFPMQLLASWSVILDQRSCARKRRYRLPLVAPPSASTVRMHSPRRRKLVASMRLTRRTCWQQARSVP